MNLESIARRCGVSRSTVSRVINHSPNVSPEVRERVMKVVRETNFQPNMAARGLAAGASRILGLVIPQPVAQFFVDPYFPLLIQGISAACTSHDYAMMLWLVEPEQERRIARQILHAGLIDGVVMTSQQVDDPLIDAMLERNFPFVMIGRAVNERPVTWVDVDNIEAVCRAVTHLTQMGRRRIATITGSLMLISSRDRLTGYQLALQAAGLPINPELIIESNYQIEGGYVAMQTLLAHQPDAVFCASDAMAQGAMRAITEAGLSIPQDVAVVGFDDMPFAAHLKPPLTTVRQPVQRLGETAVDLLIQRLKQPSDSQPTVKTLTTELIIRSSCGAQ